MARYRLAATARYRGALSDLYPFLENQVMKVVLTLALIVATLGGCAIVPLAPPVAYVAPRRIAVAPVVVVRPFYFRRWDRD